MDTRPEDCRFRQKDEGRAYPRSGCFSCGKTLITGLGRECTVAATPEPVAPTPEPMVKLADVIAVIDDNQYALERVPVGWNLLVKIRAGINAIPVAPTPSPAPDIAGLVSDLAEWGRQEDEGITAAGHSILTQAATALQCVAQERDAARETNRELHRRAQAHESKQQELLRETGYYEQKSLAKMWSASWKQEFDRVCSSHQHFKAIYEIAAKALGLPYGKYHSVMDMKFAQAPHKNPDRRIFANVYVNYPDGGCESFDVIDAVKSLADRAEAAEARLSSARDEGLEMAAKVAEGEIVGGRYRTWPLLGSGDYGPSNPITIHSDELAAAIRALKGTKP